MKNTKNLLKTIGFLSGLVLLILAASMLFRRKDGVYVYDSLVVDMRTKDLMAEPENSLDILFMGDSETTACFSPNHLNSEYGYHSYVCGTAGQKICDSYVILKDAFKNQSPTLVFLETNIMYRTIKEDDEKSDAVMNYLTDHVTLFANHSDWKRWIRSMLPEQHDVKRRKEKGFVVRKGVYPYKGGEYMEETTKKKEIPEGNLVYLQQIADLCREKNVSLVLVSAPSAKNWNYKKHNGVEEWAAMQGLPYIDLNLEEKVDINWKKDTHDGGDHLNLKGAKKVTSYMGEYIRENYPDIVYDSEKQGKK